MIDDKFCKKCLAIKSRFWHYCGDCGTELETITRINDTVITNE